MNSKLIIPVLALLGSAAYAAGGGAASAGSGFFEDGDYGQQSSHNDNRRSRPIIIDLPISTQGPFWPPAEVTDADGNFLLLGNALQEVAPGVIGLVPEQAVVVSKNTVPPLDAQGVEDPTNWFGAPYDIIRTLDLSPGSPDLDITLHSLSYGPTDDGFSGAPRIPAEGDTPFNLNKGLTICPDVFPTEVQKTNYFRPSYPLHEVPVLGFQGDNVSYIPETGEEYDPMTASDNPACAGTGCPGEDPVDTRRREPITLGDWAKYDGRLKIQLTKPNDNGEFTHGIFDFRLRDMLPNSVYTVWVVRPRVVPVPGVFEARRIGPIAVPNVLVTDAWGRANMRFEVPNPFPDPATDAQGMRITGLSVVYHSDAQNWGACFTRFGAGVDVHVAFNTFNVVPDVPGTLQDFTDFITVAP
ncbi:MAG: hypothetical protein Tsb002_00300 [Wenzhouxiangellaceae bacterium]